MVEKPAPQSKVPGEKLAKTQLHPSKPKPWDALGRSEADVIDYTPEVKRLALARVKELDLLAELFEPPRHRGNAEGRGPANICPGGNGGANITGPPAADPATGFVFITAYDGCSPTLLHPAKERDNDKMTGKTLADWVPMRGGLPRAPAPKEGDPLLGFPSLFKGPVGRIVAIDMNRGEHLWMVPHGDTAARDQEAFRNQPLMKGLTFDTNVGRRGQAALAATSTLLFASGQTADNKPQLFGIDKKTGTRVGAVAVPRTGGYGLMTYLHQGKQYVVIPVNGGYTTLALP
jgi:quinoprotein glucose dehydrogenase